MKRLLLVALLLSGCGGCESWTQPIDPVDPPPPPGPVDPVDPPPPPPPAGPRLTYAHVQAIRVGMTRVELETALGRAPDRISTGHADGVSFLIWPAVNGEGVSKRLEVKVGATGTVLGHALWPE